MNLPFCYILKNCVKYFVYVALTLLLYCQKNISSL